MNTKYWKGYGVKGSLLSRELGIATHRAPGVHCNRKPRDAEGSKSWATGPMATGLLLLPALSLSLLAPLPWRVKGKVCSTLTLKACTPETRPDLKKCRDQSRNQRSPLHSAQKPTGTKDTPRQKEHKTAQSASEFPMASSLELNTPHLRQDCLVGHEVSEAGVPHKHL